MKIPIRDKLDDVVESRLPYLDGNTTVLQAPIANGDRAKGLITYDYINPATHTRERCLMYYYLNKYSGLPVLSSQETHGPWSKLLGGFDPYSRAGKRCSAKFKKACESLRRQHAQLVDRQRWDAIRRVKTTSK